MGYECINIAEGELEPFIVKRVLVKDWSECYSFVALSYSDWNSILQNRIMNHAIFIRLWKMCCMKNVMEPASRKGRLEPVNENE